MELKVVVIFAIYHEIIFYTFAGALIPTKEYGEFDLMMQVSKETNVQLKDAVQNVTYSVERGFGRCCRLILSNMGSKLSNEHLQLCLAKAILFANLAINLESQQTYLDTAKAISLEVTRRFCTKNKNICKFNYIYPSFMCTCKGKQSALKICSNELCIVVEVDNYISDLDQYFEGFWIKQKYICKNSTREARKKINIESGFLKENTESVVLGHGIPADTAEFHFNNHSNLIAIVPSFRRSVSVADEIKREKCITFYCRHKTFIPIGEDHFPTAVLCDGRELRTDIIQGHLSLATRPLRIGDSIQSISLKGTLGGFLRYYNKDCFLTCAHVVMDTDSLVSTKKSPLHNKDLSIFVTNQFGQRVKCGNAIRCIFEQGSSHKPGIDVAVIEYEGQQMIDDTNIAIDSHGYAHASSYLGFSTRYLNDNIIDFELLTLTRATADVMAYGSESRIEGHNVTFQKEEDVDLVLHSLDQEAAVANGNVTFPVMISSPAHFQFISGLLSTPKPFRMYNQLYINFPLVAGDSGTCLYIKNYTITGCLGMAIAFLNGMSVVTPMKNIFNSID